MISKDKPADFNKRYDIVGCFIQCKGEYFLLRRQLDKANGGTWGLASGKKENNESLEEALLREVEEETGIRIAPASLNYFSSYFVRNGSFDFEWHMYSADFDEKPDIIINPNEHSEFKWVTPEESIQMDLIHDQREFTKLFYKMTYRV